VTKNLSEVSTLSRRGTAPLSRPLQPGIRFLGLPLPACPSAGLAARFPKGVHHLPIGRHTGLPCFIGVTGWVRLCLFAGESWCLRDRMLYRSTDSHERVSTTSLVDVTTFISSSHVLAIPSKPSSPPRSCSLCGLASRLALWATLSPELRTAELLPPHVRVDYCPQKGRSGLFRNSLTVNSNDFQVTQSNRTSRHKPCRRSMCRYAWSHRRTDSSKALATAGVARGGAAKASERAS